MIGATRGAEIVGGQGRRMATKPRRRRRHRPLDDERRRACRLRAQITSMAGRLRHTSARMKPPAHHAVTRATEAANRALPTPQDYRAVTPKPLPADSAGIGGEMHDGTNSPDTSGAPRYRSPQDGPERTPRQAARRAWHFAPTGMRRIAVLCDALALRAPIAPSRRPRARPPPQFSHTRWVWPSHGLAINACASGAADAAFQRRCPRCHADRGATTAH